MALALNMAIAPFIAILTSTESHSLKCFIKFSAVTIAIMCGIIMMIIAIRGSDDDGGGGGDGVSN